MTPDENTLNGAPNESKENYLKNSLAMIYIFSYLKFGNDVNELLNWFGINLMVDFQGVDDLQFGKNLTFS